MTMFYGDDDDNEEQRFRFELLGQNELIILGAQPGDARGISKKNSDWTDDNTVNRIIAFSLRNWNCNSPVFDGFLLLNISAHSDISKRDFQTNLAKIKRYLSDKNKISVLLAYGDIASSLKSDLQKIKEEFDRHKASYFCLGKTNKGNPKQICPKLLKSLPITTVLQDFNLMFGENL